MPCKPLQSFVAQREPLCQGSLEPGTNGGIQSALTTEAQGFFWQHSRSAGHAMLPQAKTQHDNQPSGDQLAPCGLLSPSRLTRGEQVANLSSNGFRATRGCSGLRLLARSTDPREASAHGECNPLCQQNKQKHAHVLLVHPCSCPRLHLCCLANQMEH